MTTAATAAPVQNTCTFARPLMATRNLDGVQSLVRLIALGDQPGKSPVYLAVDEAGHSAWDSISKFTIVDPNALPIQTGAYSTLLGSGTSTKG